MDEQMYKAVALVVTSVRTRGGYAKGSPLDKAVAYLGGEMRKHIEDKHEKEGGPASFRFWWPADAVAAAMEEYHHGMGTQHPERLITVEDFERRIKEFEAVVGEWMDNGKKGARSTLARRWGKSCGMATWDCVPMFTRMWSVVDSRFSIS
jgi:hypothetical protein